MKKVYPTKLQQGDEIRVISPSSSIVRAGGFEENPIAKERIEALGFRVTFGAHILEDDMLSSASIASRVSDFHTAFADKKVKAILTTIGGYNCNELIPYIDWELVRKNPKAFIGYSDTTSLHNAIFAKTGLVTYYGPAYSSFKMDELQDFQTSEWLKSLTEETYDLEANNLWTSDPWYDLTQPRYTMKNKWKVYSEGFAKGVITGGNLGTYFLQAGTEFFIKVNNPIVFIENAEEDDILNFDRQLTQVLQINSDLKGLVIGRFPSVTKMSEDILFFILEKFPVLKKIPVIYDVDFGHTQPIFTFPLGGEVEISTTPLSLKILKG
ncbi:S66 family peptidase [Lactovum miscens]|uniref:Muramoyltetrapeptide carboxypeptidase LdcA involved in peptidoglycan recycling n=1 Tax=Lactovum miscens TaxID=190387 RepID=A0A841C8B8_9LACT|nr:S66 peptidase family protein [Lactovum miscens]MBB5887832.1 muramoyltetrapeptide carboxypeptidase LdcA involved in peptidoglycan recycling [Lactovum miscens]